MTGPMTPRSPATAGPIAAGADGAVAADEGPAIPTAADSVPSDSVPAGAALTGSTQNGAAGRTDEGVAPIGAAGDPTALPVGTCARRCSCSSPRSRCTATS